MTRKESDRLFFSSIVNLLSLDVDFDCSNDFFHQLCLLSMLIQRRWRIVIVSVIFLVADTQLYKSLCPSVRLLVGWSVCEHKSKSVKTRISAPAHPSATGIGRVSGLVLVACFTPLCSSVGWCGDFNYGPCPPTRDWGSRVSGLVAFYPA